MNRMLKVVLAIVVVVVVLGGAGVWWYLRDDAPEQVNLTDAVAQVDDGSTIPADQVDGTWSVDTTSGEFDYDSATGSFVGFRIDEELAGVGKTEAVGRTGDLTGSLTLAGSSLTAAHFEAQVDSITTDRSMRDAQVRRALDSSRFPTTSFTLTEPVDFGDAAVTGEPVQATAKGDLTIRGVTKPVEVAIEAQLTGSTIVVTGSLPVTFADYEVAVPQSRSVLSVADHGIVEFQLLFTK